MHFEITDSKINRQAKHGLCKSVTTNAFALNDPMNVKNELYLDGLRISVFQKFFLPSNFETILK